MRRQFFAVVATAVLVTQVAGGQGPLPAYLADPATEIPWASCHVYLHGGSKHRIPFLPVVSPMAAPMGTARYTRDVRVDAPVVFVGAGVVQSGRADAYDGIDVAGKVVLFSFDVANPGPPDSEVTLEARIFEAVRRNASAVVVFSQRESAPFPVFKEGNWERVPDVPVVAINRRSVDIILSASGIDPAGLFEKWTGSGTVTARALIARLALRIDGAFARVERPGFTFAFENGISVEQMHELADANERSVQFLLRLFSAGDVGWRRSSITYFRDFDSKVFYTHHWGRGLASTAGTFMVFDPAAVSYGLAVHENAHTLLAESWGNSSSFLNEGLARYAESAATEPDRDHEATRGFAAASRLLPLDRMVRMNVGGSPGTEIAYPAGGSFVAYLIATHGLEPVRMMYRLEGEQSSGRDSFTASFGKTLAELEQQWLRWLATRR